jgi:DNA-binding MarR family transcriptional regulator
MANAGRASGDLLNDFVLGIFRLNGFFLRAADRLTAGSGLSTARWQVLGAVLHKSLTVAAVARNMGLTRQSVQRVADILVAEGLCKFSPNPAHRRAKLLSSTDQGLDCVKQLRPKVMAWARRVREQVGGRTLDAAMASMEALLAAISTSEARLLGGE